MQHEPTTSVAVYDSVFADAERLALAGFWRTISGATRPFPAAHEQCPPHAYGAPRGTLTSKDPHREPGVPRQRRTEHPFA